MITATAHVEIDRLRKGAPAGSSIDDLTAMLLMSSVEIAIHEHSILRADGTEMMLSIAGAEHDYTATVDVEYVDDEHEEHGWIHPSRHEEFLDALLKAIDMPETEPVRFLTFAVRVRDFSVGIACMEADGEFHDSVTAPVFGHPLGTSMGISDNHVQAMRSLGQRIWGKAWEPQRCHHNKNPMMGTAVLEIPLDDDADD